MLGVLLTVPVFVVGAIFCCGRHLGRKGAVIGTVGALSSALSCILMAARPLLRDGDTFFCDFGTLPTFGVAEISFSVQFDALSAVLAFAICFVSLLVHIYSYEYMGEDPHAVRFFVLLGLFSSFMVLLVCASNLFVFLIGWEGIGVCSYLLIGFWSTRVQASKAALKALLVNRVGDVALICAMGLCLITTSSLDFSVLAAAAPFLASVGIVCPWSFLTTLSDFICICLLIAAVGKSAQFGLHVWLPDAMEGPTPVSALIHAATMVTAGVFLVLRCAALFEYAPTVSLLMLAIGAVTALITAAVGAVQYDIKKIIAYSTCSQLGFMFAACGVSNYVGALFHLFNHAFFKALLFLVAGVVIHISFGLQDSRMLGGLLGPVPFLYVVLLVGVFALAGLPFTTGYYSKDAILLAVAATPTHVALAAFWALVLASVFTFIYSAKLVWLLFGHAPSAPRPVVYSLGAVSMLFNGVLCVLALVSLVVGYMTKDFFSSFGLGGFAASFSHAPHSLQGSLPDVLFAGGVGLLPLIWFVTVGVVVFVCTVLGSMDYQLAQPRSFLTVFIRNRFGFDYIYAQITMVVLRVGFVVVAVLDKGLLELLGPISITAALDRLSTLVARNIPQTTSFGGFVLVGVWCCWGFIVLLVDVVRGL